jgi:hypothetical protein
MGLLLCPGMLKSRCVLAKLSLRERMVFELKHYHAIG